MLALGVLVGSGAGAIITRFLGQSFDAKTVEVTMTVEGGSGAVMLDQTKTLVVLVTQPNGEDCEPTCHEATTEFTL